MQPVADLLHRVFLAFQQGLGLEDDIVFDPVGGIASADLTNHLREVFRGETEFICIELDATSSEVMLLY